MLQFAPIALFVFNRPEHTRQTLEALARNVSASETELFIFCDGPRDDRDSATVIAVRGVVKEVQGFAKCTVIERVENLGLAKSIISGVSALFSKYEKIIVLEDDLITSTFFIEYMNEALDFYKTDQGAFSITGYTLPAEQLGIPEDYAFDTYAGYRCSSWSWGTWRDRWARVDWDMRYYRDFLQDIEVQEGFARGGRDVLRMLQFQYEGKIDSWAIRFCYAHFQNEMHCIYPIKTLVRNNGLDNTGVHSHPDPRFVHVEIDNDWRPFAFCSAQNVDARIASAFKSAMEKPAVATKRRRRTLGEHVARIRNSLAKRLSWTGLFSSPRRIKADILFANTYQWRGGAARAAWRLFSGVRAIRPDSRYLALYRDDDDSDVIGLDRRSKQGKRARRFERRSGSTLDGYPKRDRASFFSPGTEANRARVRLDQIQPALVHLHWIARGLLNVDELGKVDCPVVWTLHDAWAFTGGCHYTGTCRGFLADCGRCPQLGSTDHDDLSHQMLEKKREAYVGLDLTIVTPSAWLAAIARQSSVFSGRRIEVIPNGLDTSYFCPRDHNQARARVGLSGELPIILFGASLTNDRRKGGDLLIAALDRLDFPCTLLTFGDNSETTDLPTHVHFHSLGNLDDDDLLIDAYSAANIYVCASREDNLPNTVAEALACGTPCAAFCVGGLTDMIEHKVTGWLATPFEPDSLAEGLRWLINHPEPAALRSAARQKALNEYRLETNADKYAALYADLIRERRTKRRG